MTAYGGRAGISSVTFYNRDYTVKARRANGGKFKLESVKNTAKNHFNFLDSVPFARGVVNLLRLIVSVWKLLVVAILIISVFKLLGSYSGIELKLIFNSTENNSILQNYYLLILGAIFIKISNIGKYHAAEHMVANTFDKNGALTIANVRKSSRVHRSCGANFFVFLFSINILLINIFDNNAFNFFIAYIIAYELFIVRNKIAQIFFKPFYWLGSLLQYLLLTSPPKDEHLQIAIESMNELLRLSKDEKPST